MKIRTILRLLFLFAGVAIIVVLARNLGVEDVMGRVKTLGWAFPLILVPYVALFWFDVIKDAELETHPLISSFQAVKELQPPGILDRI